MQVNRIELNEILHYRVKVVCAPNVQMLSVVFDDYKKIVNLKDRTKITFFAIWPG
jgi:hypothetical protein